MTQIQSVNMKATRLTVNADKFVKVWRKNNNNNNNNKQKKYSKVFPYRKRKDLNNQKKTNRSFHGKVERPNNNQKKYSKVFPFSKRKDLKYKSIALKKQL